MKQPRDHWSNFLAEMKKQAEKVEGFGEEVREAAN